MRMSRHTFCDLMEYEDEEGSTTFVAFPAAVPRDRLDDAKTLTCPIGRSKARCFCIKMTLGSFAEYTSSSLLHAGVSDSAGRVYNFDERGRRVERAWSECVSVPLSLTGVDDEAFDNQLREYDRIHSQQVGRAYSHRIFRVHDENQHPGHNCFSYVVGFLNHVKLFGRSNHSVQSIERTLLTAPMMDAVAYLRLWRTLSRAGGGPSVLRRRNRDALCHPHILRHFRDDSRPWICDACSRSFSQQRNPRCERFRCASGCDFDLCGECEGSLARRRSRGLPKDKKKIVVDLSHEEGDDGDMQVVGQSNRSSHLRQAEALTSARPPEPKSCAGGCGFYGSSSTNGFCSLCWKKRRSLA